jgi:hypothetical protein
MHQAYVILAALCFPLTMTGISLYGIVMMEKPIVQVYTVMKNSLIFLLAINLQMTHYISIIIKSGKSEIILLVKMTGLALMVIFGTYLG